MKEHTIVKMRQLLSQEDSTVVSTLKEKEKHKNRVLSERVLSKREVMAKYGMNKPNVFSKGFSNMEPIYSPRTASSLEKLGVGRSSVGILRGLKRAAEASKLKTRSVFDDPKAEECAKKFRPGSGAYYRCVALSAAEDGDLPGIDSKDDVRSLRQMLSPHRMLRGAVGQKKSMEVPLPSGMSTRDKKHLVGLQRVLHGQIYNFGDVKELAAAIASLKKSD